MIYFIPAGGVKI